MRQEDFSDDGGRSTVVLGAGLTSLSNWAGRVFLLGILALNSNSLLFLDELEARILFIIL